ncbi:MAG: DUF2452 domain-containing protein [Halioglobus sp.]
MNIDLQVRTETLPLFQPKPNPNPQGKGLVPVLQDLASLQSCVAARKSAADFFRDYCVSSMILGATFGFKPVVGKDYFLYVREQNFSLSLIAPHEWGQCHHGEFLARCELRPDMTWEMDTAELNESSTALAAARDFIEQFVSTIAEQDSISENLPFYVSQLPYYQRMLSTALASSLRQCMPDKADDMKAVLKEQSELITLAHFSPLPLQDSAAIGADSGLDCDKLQ